MTLFYSVLFAIFNRARGSQLFGLTSSTTAGRLVSTLGMALATSCPMAADTWHDKAEILGGCWLLLFFWSVWRWDAYWSAAIGSDPLHSRFWGVMAMTVRQSLILPFYAFVAGFNATPHPFYALSFLLMGVTYTLSSVITPGKNTIRNVELINGAIMGATVWLIQ